MTGQWFSEIGVLRGGALCGGIRCYYIIKHKNFSLPEYSTSNKGVIPIPISNLILEPERGTPIFYGCKETGE